MNYFGEFFVNIFSYMFSTPVGVLLLAIVTCYIFVFWLVYRKKRYTSDGYKAIFSPFTSTSLMIFIILIISIFLSSSLGRELTPFFSYLLELIFINVNLNTYVGQTIGILVSALLMFFVIKASLNRKY